MTGDEINARYDQLRCRSCGQNWSAHDPSCFRHAFMPPQLITDAQRIDWLEAHIFAISGARMTHGAMEMHFGNEADHKHPFGIRAVIDNLIRPAETLNPEPSVNGVLKP